MYRGRSEKMKTQKDLRLILENIDKKSYPAYKSTKGSYTFGNYVLNIDHVQGDPFAAPSAVSVEVPASINGFPKEYRSQRHRRIALEDLLIRVVGKLADECSYKVKGSGKSGLIQVSRPGQEILERTSCHIDPNTGDITFRLDMGFPASGRTVRGFDLEKMLFDFLPDCVADGLIFRNLNRSMVEKRIELADDQMFLRNALEKLDLCAFVANGAVLPRESGVSDRPLDNAVPFISPESLRITLQLPHHGQITGMGIEKGITVIVGGGFHGKSTLLKAIERGVYNHVENDGREFVITDATAMKIRAEDGRSIAGTDISMFINNLPGKRDTRHFYTDNASGSTSQAANVVEAIEAHSGVMLIDEDTSATNFMVRDELMQRVISRHMEPITPYISRARMMADKKGISTILAVGSSGEWFYHADTVVQMDHYIPKDITNEAKKAAEAYARERRELEAMAEIGREVTGAILQNPQGLKALAGDPQETKTSEENDPEAALNAELSPEYILKPADTKEFPSAPSVPEDNDNKKAVSHDESISEDGNGRSSAELIGIEEVHTEELSVLNEETLERMEQKIADQIHEVVLNDQISNMMETDEEPNMETGWPRLKRKPLPGKEFAGERLKIRIDGKSSFSIGRQVTDLHYLEQLCDPEQARMIAAMLVYAERNLMNGKLSMTDIVTELMNIAEFSGMEELIGGSYSHAGFAMPRQQEILAGFSRYRGLKMQWRNGRKERPDR